MYRRLPVHPAWVRQPAECLDESDQCNSHLQNCKLLSQTSAAPSVEADKLSPGPSQTIMFLNGYRRVSPPTGLKRVSCWTPRSRVSVSRVAVVAQVSSLGNGNAPTQQGILACLPIDQLPDGWEKSQAFVNNCGQKGHVLKGVWVRTCPAVQALVLDFGIKLVLRILCHSLANAEVGFSHLGPTYRVHRQEIERGDHA
jgi:hypothetical protein